MRRLTAGFFLFLLCLGAGASLAQAQTSRLYFAGYLGLQSNTESKFDESTAPLSGDFAYDNTIAFAGALGVRIDSKWRAEGELSYRKLDVSSTDVNSVGHYSKGGSLSTWLALANVYYDFDLDWKDITPYVTGGLGFAFHSGDLTGNGGLPNSTGNSFGLAYQAGGGLKYRVEDDMAFTAGYRYVGTTSLEIDGYNIDYGAHEFRLGLEYDIPVK